MSKLVVISAPSGAGKTTLCAKLLEAFPELELSISTTTRSPRGQEKNGREYHFVDKTEFEKEIQAGRFAEWAKVHDNYYGTSKAVIEKAPAVLLDIDVQGAESLKRAYSESCLTVFVAPPSMQALESRLRSRGTDSEETIQKRLKNARAEMTKASEFDRIIVNDSLDAAFEELQAIVSRFLRGRTDG